MVCLLIEFYLNYFVVVIVFPDGGSSLLKHPSKAMEKLIKSTGRGGSLKKEQMDKEFQLPVLSFVVEKHDLESLQLAMRQALRKAACRVFALQVS